MPRLPQLDGYEVIKALKRAGFVEMAAGGGSHRNMKKEGIALVVTVPVRASKPLKKGTLRAIIRDAGLTVDQFCALL